MLSDKPGAFTIETYDINRNFKVYLEFMKRTFQASHHNLHRFQEFAGADGKKYLDRLNKWSRSSEAILLHLKNHERIIGILEGRYQSENRGLISTLFIHPDFRRQGHAQNLESAAIKFFKSHQCLQVFLNVAQANLPATRYYQSSGWKPHQQSTYPDAICFFKNI